MSEEKTGADFNEERGRLHEERTSSDAFHGEARDRLEEGEAEARAAALLAEDEEAKHKPHADEPPADVPA